jgi:hypothetical protein
MRFNDGDTSGPYLDSDSVDRDREILPWKRRRLRRAVGSSFDKNTCPQTISFNPIHDCKTQQCAKLFPQLPSDASGDISIKGEPKIFVCSEVTDGKAPAQCAGAPYVSCGFAGAGDRHFDPGGAPDQDDYAVWYEYDLRRISSWD